MFKSSSKKGKYKNKKVEKYGVKWDSKMELDYYEHLLKLQEQGIVTDIELQPRFLLQPSFKYQGKTIRKMEYVSDFKVTYADGYIEVVDTKGVKTADFKLKHKMVKYLNQDTVFKCVQRRGTSKSGYSWIEI